MTFRIGGINFVEVKKMIIETDRLILREWKMSDIEDNVEGLNNFNVTKNLTVKFPYTKQDAICFIEKHRNNDEENYYFAIQLKNENKVIGGTAILVDKHNMIGKGGIWINEKYLGKGYGTEVWIARAKFAFENLSLKKLQNGYFEFNEISWKMQKKVGYKIVGEKTNFSKALNQKVKEIVTELTKSEFNKALEKNFKQTNFTFKVLEDNKYL